MQVKGGITFAALIGLAGNAVAAGTPVQSTPSAPPAPKTRQLCGLTAPSVAAFEPQVAKLSGIARKAAQNGYSVYIDEANRRVWDFTTPTVPGHPAAACISVTPNGTGSDITVDIICEGNKADCDVIAASFQDLAARVAGGG